jgi:hypothetical protein
MDESREPTLGVSRPDDTARDYIAGRIKAGASRQAVVQELVQRGYDPAVARDLVGSVAGKQAISARKSGLLYLIAGIAITVLAVAVTIGSYNTASQQGGIYYVCWGFALFGLYLTFRGLAQLLRGRETK